MIGSGSEGRLWIGGDGCRCHQRSINQSSGSWGHARCHYYWTSDIFDSDVFVRLYLYRWMLTVVSWFINLAECCLLLLVYTSFSMKRRKIRSLFNFIFIFVGSSKEQARIHRIKQYDDGNPNLWRRLSFLASFHIQRVMMMRTSTVLFEYCSMFQRVLEKVQGWLTDSYTPLYPRPPPSFL